MAHRPRRGHHEFRLHTGHELVIAANVLRCDEVAHIVQELEVGQAVHGVEEGEDEGVHAEGSAAVFAEKVQ